MQKKIIPIIFFLLLAPIVFGQVTIDQNPQTNPNQPPSDTQMLAQILAVQSEINQKLSELPDKKTVQNQIQIGAIATENEVIVYLLIFMVVFEIFHWLIFFWLIGNHKIPVLDNKKEVLP